MSTEKHPAPPTVTAKILFLDLDETIVQNHRGFYKDGTLSWNNPEHRKCIIPGSLELMITAQKAGFKVGIVSHTSNKDFTENFLNDALKSIDPDFKLDAFITLADIKNTINFITSYTQYSQNTFPRLTLTQTEYAIKKYGKGASPFMAKLALKEIGISGEQYKNNNSNIQVCMVGDQASDLLFAGHMRTICAIKGALAVHGNFSGYPLYGVELEELRNAYLSLKAIGIPARSVTGYEAIANFLRLDISIQAATPPKDMHHQEVIRPTVIDLLATDPTERKIPTIPQYPSETTFVERLRNNITTTPSSSSKFADRMRNTVSSCYTAEIAKLRRRSAVSNSAYL